MGFDRASSVTHPPSVRGEGRQERRPCPSQTHCSPPPVLRLADVRSCVSSLEFLYKKAHRDHPHGAGRARSACSVCVYSRRKPEWRGSVWVAVWFGYRTIGLCHSLSLVG